MVGREGVREHRGVGETGKVVFLVLSLDGGAATI